MKKTIVFFYVFLYVSKLLTCETENQRIEIAYFELAEALYENGNHQEALKNYKNTISCNLEHASALFKAGVLAYQSGDTPLALTFFQKRLQINPSCTQTHICIAKCCIKDGNFDKAIEHYQYALNQNSLLPEANYELGNLLKKQKQFTRAIECFRQELKQAPNHVRALYQLAKTNMLQEQYEEAILYYDRLLTIKENNPTFILKKAYCFSMLGDMHKALSAYFLLLDLFPNNAIVLYNIARTYKQQGNTQKALHYYHRSLQADSTHKPTYLGLAEALLHQGKYQEGWQAMELWDVAFSQNNKLLTNLDNVQGKTIFIRADWFHENMIQFLRYAKLLKEMGATIILQTPEALAKLFQHCPYLDNIAVIHQKEIPAFDQHVALMSLPHLFKTTEKTVPQFVPYLTIPSDLQHTWEQKIRTNNRLKIGVHFNSAQNLPIKKIIKTACMPITDVYILHRIKKAENILPKKAITHCIGNGLQETKEDMPHLAATINNLDLVIADDCTIAHLAGALNVPVWVLLPKVANWRWEAKRKDSPWYPSMRLFRQKKRNDWTAVIKKIKKNLKRCNVDSINRPQGPDHYFFNTN